MSLPVTPQQTWLPKQLSRQCKAFAKKPRDLQRAQAAANSTNLEAHKRPRVGPSTGLQNNAVPGVRSTERRFVDFLNKEGLDVSLLAKSQHAKDCGLKPKSVYRNLTPAALYEKALAYEPGTHITSTGALVTTSGAKTGRSPNDKHVVSDATSGEIWRGDGSPNNEMDEKEFLANRTTAINYFNSCDRVYVVDAFANWDPKARAKVRVITTRAYHALFMQNMLIRPTEEELCSFGEPDFVIYNAGACPAIRGGQSSGGSGTSVDVSLKHGEMVILGTEYAGEMKKGVFSVMHYLMPKRGILSLHAGCNIGEKDDVSLFFGLSGTGKTTLSTDPKRPLIGDDEHCWGDDGVFNIEGGCYAKCIGLKPASEPEIFQAIRFGTVLENVAFDPSTRVVDFNSKAITENTRASYPIDYIPNARIPCIGPHPRNVILLTCDAFGVLPPVSRLSLEQAMYHFISGYTSKVAGTEVGVKDPEATFSACYGSAFLMWHPYKYAQMLCQKLHQHQGSAWLVNTGWTGGQAGVGHRISLKHTRAIIDAIHSGELAGAEYMTSPYFKLQVPTCVSTVPGEVLQPQLAWKDPAQFEATLRHLVQLFSSNFCKYQNGASYVGEDLAAEIARGGPSMS